MREILFRGNRKYDGKWFEGYYYLSKNGKEAFILFPCTTFPWWDKAVVDPSTVGQYTGLTDKNGKKIFEGDIVEYPIEQGKYSKQNIHEVVFERRHGTAYFGIKMSDIETWGFDLTVPAKLMKVIGNIHDNPDLLDVEE